MAANFRHLASLNLNKKQLAQLPPGNEHGPDNQRDVGMVKYQSFNLLIEGHSPHRDG